MSTFEVVGMFTVIFATGIALAAVLISLGVTSTLVYRWAKRGFRMEQEEIEYQALTRGRGV